MDYSKGQLERRTGERARRDYLRVVSKPADVADVKPVTGECGNSAGKHQWSQRFPDRDSWDRDERIDNRLPENSGESSEREGERMTKLDGNEENKSSPVTGLSHAGFFAWASARTGKVLAIAALGVALVWMLGQSPGVRSTIEVGGKRWVVEEINAPND